MSIRVSVSDVDQLFYYLDHDNMDMAELLARLRRQQPETEAMRIGTAFHSVLETAPEEAALSTATANGYTFLFELDDVLSMPAIREYKEERVYIIDGERVTLVGKVDTVALGRVDDHKFTLSPFDCEKYLSAYQWRMYLSMFECGTFRYNVFEGYADRKRSNTFIVKKYNPLTLYRYSAMEHDVFSGLKRYVDFCRTHLPEKFTHDAPEVAAA